MNCMSMILTVKEVSIGCRGKTRIIQNMQQIRQLSMYVAHYGETVLRFKGADGGVGELGEQLVGDAKDLVDGFHRQFAPCVSEGRCNDKWCSERVGCESVLTRCVRRILWTDFIDSLPPDQIDNENSECVSISGVVMSERICHEIRCSE